MWSCDGRDIRFTERRIHMRPEAGVLSLDPSQRKIYSRIIDDLYWMAFDILKPIIDPKLEWLRTGYDEPDMVDYEEFNPMTNQYVRYMRHKPDFLGFINAKLEEKVKGKMIKLNKPNSSGSDADTDVMLYSVSEQIVADYILAIDFIECGMAKDAPGLKMAKRMVMYFESYMEHSEYEKMITIVERMIKNHFVLKQDVIDALCRCSNSQALMEVLKMDDGSVFTPSETLKLE